MSRLHVVLWLWKGWRPIYSRRDVAAVATMIRERGGLPDSTRILLLTDQPTDWWKARTDALGVEEYRLWPDPVPFVPSGRANCYRRLRIFNPMDQMALGIQADDVIMSMDLDSVVSGPLGGLLAPFHNRSHTFAGMEGVASRIHGSLFAFRAASHAHLWSRFHPIRSPLALAKPWADGKRPIGSDQAWMTRHVTGEYLWRRQDGCYSWNRHGCLLSPRYTDNAAYWSFAGHMKPGLELVKQVRPDLHGIWMDAYNRETPPAEGGMRVPA